jgi:hypothetical protein
MAKTPGREKKEEEQEEEQEVLGGEVLKFQIATTEN